MKLALVYPPFYHKAYNENLPTVDEEFGFFPYISFGYVAYSAKKIGWDVKLFDCSSRNVDYQTLLNELTEYNPDLLGFAAHAAQTFTDMLSWAKKIKKDTNLPILIGGYEAKNYPQEMMTHRCFDYLCSGESDPFLEAFLPAFSSGQNFEKVPDLYYRKDNRVEYTFKGEKKPFHSYPTPDRSIFDHSLYYSHVSQHRNFTIGVSSYGCPHNCSFCCMRTTPYNPKKAAQIADEMEDCYHNYNIKEIDWFDPVMFESKKRILELVEEIEKRNILMIWSARTRIEALCLEKSYKPDISFIKKIAKSGCKRLFVGIESGDEEIQKNIQKNISPQYLSEVIQSAADHGIMVLGFFMIGNPGETPKNILNTIKLAKSLPLHYAQFSMTIMKPNTLLCHQYMEDSMGKDYWRELILGKETVRPLPTPWTSLTRADQEFFAKKAYLSFYLRPKYILKILSQIKSISELWRYVRVAISLILRQNESKKYSLSSKFIKAVEHTFIFLFSSNHRHPLNRKKKSSNKQHMEVIK